MIVNHDSRDVIPKGNFLVTTALEKRFAVLVSDPYISLSRCMTETNICLCSHCNELC